MKVKKIILILILTLVITSIQFIDVFYWWSFLVGVFIFGVIIPFEKWDASSFLTGFISGFLSWALSTLFFAMYYEGEILIRVGEIFMMPPFLEVLLSGVIGGVLTGLALYSGMLLMKEKEVY